MTRKKIAPKFLTKVVFEALKEQMTIQEYAIKHNIVTQQISTWKREFLNVAEEVFAKRKRISQKTEQEQMEDQLLKMIGQQKVEINFFKKPLR